MRFSFVGVDTISLRRIFSIRLPSWENLKNNVKWKETGSSFTLLSYNALNFYTYYGMPNHSILRIIMQKDLFQSKNVINTFWKIRQNLNIGKISNISNAEKKLFQKRKKCSRRSLKSGRNAPPISHETPEDPRYSWINATLKKGSTGTREPIDNARALFPPSLPPPFSLTLSLSAVRPKITRVRLAPVASMTKVGRPGPELRAPTRFEQPAPEAATFVFI